jgi:hypothetical protein
MIVHRHLQGGSIETGIQLVVRSRGRYEIIMRRRVRDMSGNRSTRQVPAQKATAVAISFEQTMLVRGMIHAVILALPIWTVAFYLLFRQG